MKRVTSILLTILMAFAVCQIAFAADSVPAFVTISDKTGTLRVAYEKIDVKDIDSDGKLTVNDALYCAHEKYYHGGAAAGYAYKDSAEYGLSLTKLWGAENNGGFGYWLNDKSCWNLADEISEGDHVYAFVYTDTEKWSDAYTYFDTKVIEGKSFQEVTVTVKTVGSYDEYYQPVIVPLEGAKITLNGKMPGERVMRSFVAVTDAEGKATFRLPIKGDYTISANTLDGKIITPPVCKASVEFNFKNIITNPIQLLNYLLEVFFRQPISIPMLSSSLK